MITGHMGHGHSHGGQAHSHGGHKESKNGTDTEPSVTTVVIVNEPVLNVNELEEPPVETSEAGQPASLEDKIDELSSLKVHNTPSRFQMGIMLAAIQAGESGNKQEFNNMESYSSEFYYPLSLFDSRVKQAHRAS